MSEIIPWYDGRTILITGATGFMGKVLLEKLLRCVPGIKRIYILCRSKRGLSPNGRLTEMFKLPLFQQCLQKYPDCMKKVVVLEGDVAHEDLDLSNNNKSLVRNEVSVVFHGAATLKLEAKLKDSLIQNTIGTQNVMNLCKTIVNLQSVVHLSTAFCHPDIDNLEEYIYEPSRNPQDVLNFMKWIDEESLDQITPSILGQHPNTYTFTKRLAEAVARDAGDEIPIVIVRPSIVIPTLQEPIEGWVDSLNGPIGILVAAGKGVIRSMLTNPNHHAQIIPVDIAANGIILCAYMRATKSFTETPAYNVTQSDVVSITWGEILEYGRSLLYEYPFEWPLWYPDGNIRTNKFIHYLIVFLFQWIPAYFLDLIFFLTLQKRFMIRIQNRISLGMKLLQYFTLREWNFKNKKFLAISKALNDVDRQIFYTDNVEVDVKNYLKFAILGARQYCMKEKLTSLPKAKVYMHFLYILDRVMKVAAFGCVIWMIINVNSSLNHYHDKYYEAI